MRSLMFGICLVLPLGFAAGCGDDNSSDSGGVAGKGGAKATGGSTNSGGDEGKAGAKATAGSAATGGKSGAGNAGAAGENPSTVAGAAGASDVGAAGNGGAGGEGSAEPTVANAVYVMTNAVAANQILGFARALDGSLTPMAAGFATGGAGTGKGLGEQGALAYDRKHNRILTVNAGDNSFSVLAVQEDASLGAPLKVTTSGFPASASNLLGPKSVTFWGDLAYVLYEGDATHPSMIAGWKLSGTPLVAMPIAGSALTLSSDSISADPAQIEFSPDGKLLVVTEKQNGNGTTVVAGPGSIDTFTVAASGLATKKDFYPTAKTGDEFQKVPFGFEFWGSFLVVSEAGSQGVGSYTYAGGVIKPVATGQFLPTDPAPCWVTFSGYHAYVTNARGPNISGFNLADNGALSSISPITNSIVASTGEVIAPAQPGGMPTIHGPTDEFVSIDGKYLYVLDSAVPAIGIFEVLDNGLLVRVGDKDYAPIEPDALPAGAVGIVAR